MGMELLPYHTANMSLLVSPIVHFLKQDNRIQTNDVKEKRNSALERIFFHFLHGLLRKFPSIEVLGYELVRHNNKIKNTRK